MRKKLVFTSMLLACSMSIGTVNAFSAIISDVPSAVSTSESSSTEAPPVSAGNASTGSSSDTSAAAGTASGSSASTAADSTVSASGSAGSNTNSADSTGSTANASASSGSSQNSAGSSNTGSSTADSSSSSTQDAASTGTATTSIIRPGTTAQASSTGPTATGSSHAAGTVAASSSASGAVIVDVPGAISAADSSTSVSIDVSSVQSGPAPGSSYQGTSSTSVDLGFILISPSYSYNGFNVAEGKVQLANGSWVSIGHDKYIRQPYYKLLREDGDWYVVSVHASRIGNYSTADGSTVTELWLKKSDCTASSSIELNTTNATRQQIVKEALSLLGKGYRYAGNGPDAFDCSGFVHSIMSSFGINTARNSSGICKAGTEVGINGLRPGDIVGRPGHVGIYIGNGCFVHAAETASGVIADSVAIYNSSSAAFSAYRNVVGD